MVLPEGFGLPSLPYLLILFGAVIVSGGLLYREQPRVSRRDMLSLGAWMVAGAAFHALYQLGTAPNLLKPLFGTPAVYFTTFALAATVWYLAEITVPHRVPESLVVSGTVVFIIGIAVIVGSANHLNLVLSAATVGAAVGLAAFSWLFLARIDPEATNASGGLGLLVVFAHALDGVSTAVGADLLAFSERTPLSAAILDFAGSLPTADILGTGWLFVVVKIGLIFVVLHLFSEYVREEPVQASLLLTLIAAVGLGPGAQNVLLYLVW